MRARRVFAVSAILVGIAGCNAYEYRPEENANAQVRGRIAASYDVPPEHPQGTVRVASFGVVKLKPDKTRALSVRMIVENNSLDQPWTVDTRQLKLELRGYGAETPITIATESGESPIVRVQPHGKQVIDAFYPLPQGAHREGKIPAFDFVWQVQTPTQTYAERTPFERMALYADYGYPYGYYGAYGAYWPSIAWGWPGWYL